MSIVPTCREGEQAEGDEHAARLLQEGHGEVGHQDDQRHGVRQQPHHAEPLGRPHEVCTHTHAHAHPVTHKVT